MSDEITFAVPTYPTSWQAIDGWTDFEDLYVEAVTHCPPGAVLVEVGTWFGRSAALMCSTIREQNKPVSFFCVDTWKGTQSGECKESHQKIVAALGGDMFDTFHHNLHYWRGLYVPLRMTSQQASELFPEHSVHFVFLDGDHTTEGVLKDIDCWRSKIISGGVLAGHDYNWTSVKKAVCDRFPGHQSSGSSWYVKL
jgi:cephalosporin hydroxylase